MSYKGRSTVLQKTASGWRATEVSGAGNGIIAEKVYSDDSGLELGAFCEQLQSQGIARDNIVLALDSDSSSLRYHGVPPVPSWRLELILKYEIEEVAERTGDQLSGGHIELQVPESESDDTLLLLGMGKDHLVQPLIDEIGGAGGRVRHAVPASMGPYHVHLATAKISDDETVMLGDIGDSETQVLLVSGDRLLFARSVRFGLNQFVESVSERCSVSISEAEDMTAAFIDGDLVSSADSVQQCFRGWLSQLSQSLGSSINFCKAQLKMDSVEAHRLRLSGTGAELALLGGELASSLELRAELMALEGLPDTSWCAAAGVGASVLDADDRVVDLLPAVERQRKTFREKTIFLYGAIACFLLTLGVQFLDATVAGGRSEDAKAVLQGWESKINAWTRQENDARKENDVLRKRESRILDEVETGRFYASVLDGLRVSLPQEVSVDLILLRRQAGTGELGIEIELQGRSDNSGRRGVDAIDELRGLLEGIVGVKRVKADLQDLKSGSYPFQITVSPDDSMPEAGTRNRNRNSRPRSPFGRN